MKDKVKEQDNKSLKDDKADKKNVKNEEKEVELSEEDKQLQDELSMLIGRLNENDSSLYIPALESLRVQIRSATTSMTSVPKPLKFLRPFYGNLKEIYEKMPTQETKQFTADIISIMAMTVPSETNQSGDSLKYRLLGSREEIGSWGHEYVRHLSGEIAVEWQSDGCTEEQKNKLLSLVKEIIPYNMSHNAEAEAADLLMEIEKLELLEQYIDNDDVCSRVCLYLTSCVPFVPDPENTNLLKTSLKIFLKFKKYPEALRLAMQLGDLAQIKDIFNQCTDSSIQKQMAFMVGRQQIFLMDDIEDPDLTEIMSNAHLNTNFVNFYRELDIAEPKTPDDIYKTHLENPTRPSFGTGGSVDSARANLASSFVNGFVNAAFGKDKILLIDEGNKWLYKNKEHGMMSATASLGLILLWDVDGGLAQIDKYLYSGEDYIKAGALLACGIVNCGVRNDCDPALALLVDYVSHNSMQMRIGAIIGLGLAYAGSNRSDVLQNLLPILSDSKSTLEVIGITALSCGLIAVGSGNGDVTSSIMQVLIEKPELEVKDSFARFLPLALGLCYLGKQEASDAIQAALEVIQNQAFKALSTTLVDICAYAATGNVLKIQHLLHLCSEKLDKDSSEEASGSKKSSSSNQKNDISDSSWQQAVATIGIALIAMAEDVSCDMAFRTFGHLLRYGEPMIKRAVPLALAIISVSNPKLNILETLSKFSHDPDTDIACNAIFAMGLIGAGTNNARLATMLRQLAQYHAKEQNCLFMVRIAQGLTHLGKGTLTLSPFNSDHQLLVPTSLAGILACVFSLLDVKQTIVKSHYLLYYLVTAIQPRMLITFDEDLKSLPVPVRVGQAVDVVGQAGKPKTITGFQTHTTPVLLAIGERAELATEEYIPLTPVLEGFVLLRKNPNYVA